MDDDDQLTAQYAAADQQRQLDDLKEQLRSLAETVGKLSAKILAAPVSATRRWNWPAFDDDERAEALNELREWMQTILCRYPEVFGRLRPCWHLHDQALDALTAAYGTWLLANGPTANAELYASWLSKWLPGCGDQLREALSECGTGRHVSDDVDLGRMG